MTVLNRIAYSKSCTVVNLCSFSLAINSSCKIPYVTADVNLENKAAVSGNSAFCKITVMSSIKVEAFCYGCGSCVNLSTGGRTDGGVGDKLVCTGGIHFVCFNNIGSGALGIYCIEDCAFSGKSLRPCYDAVNIVLNC